MVAASIFGMSFAWNARYPLVRMGGEKRRYVFVNRHGPLPHRMNTVILAR